MDDAPQLGVVDLLRGKRRPRAKRSSRGTWQIRHVTASATSNGPLQWRKRGEMRRAPRVPSEVRATRMQFPAAHVRAVNRSVCAMTTHWCTVTRDDFRSSATRRRAASGARPFDNPAE
jgi:hypothetical protein